MGYKSRITNTNFFIILLILYHRYIISIEKILILSGLRACAPETSSTLILFFSIQPQMIQNPLLAVLGIDRIMNRSGKMRSLGAIRLLSTYFVDGSRCAFQWKPRLVASLSKSLKLDPCSFFPSNHHSRSQLQHWNCGIDIFP